MTTFEARRAGAEEGAPETRLDRLSLYNYRNFERLACELPAAGVAIVGPNGSGKTNLLEAIYYFQILRSFRGTRDADLVRFGEQVFRIEASVRSPAGCRSLAAAYDRVGRRKKVEIEGREPERLADAIGALGAVVFRLEDADIVRGPPAERRRFLNILLSLVSPGYVGALQRYRAVLAQRNEALRGGGKPGLVGAWTGGLVEAGALLMADRAAWVDSCAERFSEYHEAISGKTPATLVYEPSVGEVPARSRADVEAWRERFRRALAAVEERERRRGTTLVGPHRDDLAFRTPDGPGGGERDLRAFGSSGQQRTVALALRLVETDTLAERLGREPIYLLDDVFAELDEDRSGRLLSLLDEGRSGQVILTAPKPGEVVLRGGRLERWHIRNGHLWS